MPSFKHKKGYKRFRRKDSQYKVAKAVVKDALKKQLEVKHYTFGWDITIGNTLLNWNPIGINLLDYVDQGTDGDNRIGNRINLLSASLRANIVQADVPYNQMRLLVVETRQPLQLDTAGTYYSCAPLFTNIQRLGLNSFLNMSLVKKIHMDKMVTLNLQTGTYSVIKFVKKYIKFGKDGKKCVYDGDTSPTLGGATRTYLYFVAMSDSTAPAHPKLNLIWENRFTDA